MGGDKSSTVQCLSAKNDVSSLEKLVVADLGSIIDSDLS